MLRSFLDDEIGRSQNITHGWCSHSILFSLAVKLEKPAEQNNYDASRSIPKTSGAAFVFYSPHKHNRSS